MKNKKFYILYSLVVPILYVVMVFLNYRFGVAAGDTLSKPHGRISYIISSIITLMYTVLMVSQFVILFFVNRKNINVKNVLMVIANSALGFLMNMACFSGWILVGLVIAFVAGGFLIAIGYFVLYVMQIVELLKIYKEEKIEKEC